jgi:hypothetical protein
MCRHGIEGGLAAHLARCARHPTMARKCGFTPHLYTKRNLRGPRSERSGGDCVRDDGVYRGLGEWGKAPTQVNQSSPAGANSTHGLRSPCELAASGVHNCVGQAARYRFVSAFEEESEPISWPSSGLGPRLDLLLRISVNRDWKGGRKGGAPCSLPNEQVLQRRACLLACIVAESQRGVARVPFRVKAGPV